jgi:hypothetical protein
MQLRWYIALLLRKSALTTINFLFVFGFLRGLSRQKIRVLFTMELTDCYAKRFVSEQRTITLHQRDINAEKRYGVNVGQGLGLYVDAGGPIRAAPERHIFSNHTQPSSLHFGVPQLRKLDQRGAVVHFLRWRCTDERYTLSRFRFEYIFSIR